MNVQEKIKKIIENIIERKIESNLENIYLVEDLQLSSLEMLWIIIDIEKEFNIIIEEEQIYKISFVEQLVELVKNKLSQSKT